MSFADKVICEIAQRPGATDREISDRLLGKSIAASRVNQEARYLASNRQVIRRRREDNRIGNYPMNAIEWLRTRAPSFDKLSPQEVEAVMHFALLWSFFEAKALNTSASATTICAAVQGWAKQGTLNAGAFSESLAYFKDRYFSNGQPSSHLPGLNLRDNDNRLLVEAVLNGKNNDPADCVAALLIVVYRLRNNLFHGVKWAYGIGDQLGNFTHANNALISALETNGVF